MIAALPMYDWPERRAETDAFWALWRDALRRSGFDAPERLTRDRPAEAIWRDPNLLVAQTCGWPFVDRLSEATRLIATPIYGAEGCDGPHYRSMIVARRDAPAPMIDALADRSFAINSVDSWSGWRALPSSLRDALCAGGRIVETGGHRASIEAVAGGQADAAAIDAVCWRLAQQVAPASVARLQVIAMTRQVPGLPFITSGARSDEEVALIRAALFDALNHPARAHARAIISGAVFLEPADYAVLLHEPAPPYSGQRASSAGLNPKNSANKQLALGPSPSENGAVSLSPTQ